MILLTKQKPWDDEATQKPTWVTFVRSKQSTQLVLTMPLCSSIFSPFSFNNRYLSDKLMSDYRGNHNVFNSTTYYNPATDRCVQPSRLT